MSDRDDGQVKTSLQNSIAPILHWGGDPKSGFIAQNFLLIFVPTPGPSYLNPKKELES